MSRPSAPLRQIAFAFSAQMRQPVTPSAFAICCSRCETGRSVKVILVILKLRTPFHGPHFSNRLAGLHNILDEMNIGSVLTLRTVISISRNRLNNRDRLARFANRACEFQFGCEHFVFNP